LWNSQPSTAFTTSIFRRLHEYSGRTGVGPNLNRHPPQAFPTFDGSLYQIDRGEDVAASSDSVLALVELSALRDKATRNTTAASEGSSRRRLVKHSGNRVLGQGKVGLDACSESGIKTCVMTHISYDKLTTFDKRAWIFRAIRFPPGTIQPLFPPVNATQKNTRRRRRGASRMSIPKEKNPAGK
jgi:hypothetical protein